MSDEALVQKIIEGDSEVLGKIYSDNFYKVESLLKSYNKTSEDAEDIFQDAMIDMIRNFKTEKFKYDSSISTYLYTICKYKMMNQQRSNKIKTVELIELDKAEELSISDNEAENHILKELGKLSAECAKLLKGYYFYNQPLKELAKELDYTDSFVRVKSNRCKNTLRKNLASIPYMQKKYGYDIR